MHGNFNLSFVRKRERERVITQKLFLFHVQLDLQKVVPEDDDDEKMFWQFYPQFLASSERRQQLGTEAPCKASPPQNWVTLVTGGSIIFKMANLGRLLFSSFLSCANNFYFKLKFCSLSSFNSMAAKSMSWKKQHFLGWRESVN